VITYQPAAEWLERVDELHRKKDEKFADAAGVSVDDYRTAALSQLRGFVDGVEVLVRIRSERLTALLDEKVWRTLFDGVGSAGLNDLPVRTRVEQNVLGIPSTADPAERPTYGYLAGSDETGVVMYGDVILHLGAESRKSVTFCMADSLNATEGGDHPVLAAAPLEAPELIARHGETDICEAGSLLDACNPQDGYAEAHIHNQIRLLDIEWAAFTKREPDANLVRTLLDNDIPFVPPEGQ
jgi:hypothetical protein